MNRVWKIVLIVVLAVLALGAGAGIRYWVNKGTDEPGAIETPPLKKGWKIYKNPDWGFEVSYPDNWVLVTRIWVLETQETRPN